MDHGVRKVAGAVAAGLLALPAAAIQFEDVTENAGVSYQQQSPPCDWQDPNCLAFDPMSGGAATADVDGDGDSDLFVTRQHASDILYENQGDGTFRSFPRRSGFGYVVTSSNGAAFGDVDNDGDPDLYVTTRSPAPSAAPNDRFQLWINDGTGRFSEDAAARVADVAGEGVRSGYTPCFGDYDGDGWLDLHTTDWRQQTNLLPKARLLRNLGAAAPGHFQDVTGTAEVWPSSSCAGADLDDCRSYTFGTAFTDLDDDGHLDLAVAADFLTSRLFWSDRDGTFTDGTVAAAVGTDRNGMGSTFGDIDNDGDLDWFVTAIFNPETDVLPCTREPCRGNRLYRNEGNRLFSDQTDAAGVRHGWWGWGTAFFDADNDGDLDLVQTNGWPRGPNRDLFVDDPMIYWENDGTGRFTDRTADVGIDDTDLGKGLLVFDYDDDGDLDVFVANTVTGGLLLRNDGGNQNDWLRVRLQDDRGNRDGLGARIAVQAVPGGTTQMREMGTSTHFLGQSELTAHFGLGSRSPDPVHSVKVTWPGGDTHEVHGVARNQTLLLRRFDGPLCGMLGIEPLVLLLLPGLRARARRRGSPEARSPDCSGRSRHPGSRRSSR